MKKTILLYILLLVPVAVFSQSKASEFFVSSFKSLPMDLDARTLHPLLDQNGRKAALIKLVTSEKDFDFDVGIMGIVAVNKEVGEIWIYVPEKVQRITVRHPEYGVIRDYHFPVPIESGEVYEMKIRVPDTIQEQVQRKVVVEHKFVTGTQGIPSLGTMVSGAEEADSKKGSLMVLADIGMMEVTSFGVRGAWFKEAGVYLNFRSSFNGKSTSYLCSSNGNLNGGGTIWTSGKENISTMNVTGGAIYSLGRWICAYAGAGYGAKVLAWEDVNGDWAEIEDFTFKGVALDAGVVFPVGRLAFSIGVNTIKFDYAQITFGLGIRL